jgi:predicted RNA-binding protein with PUA-like domain
MNYWLVKSEPNSYSWDDLVAKGEDIWDGVRNYQARNFLREMKIFDLVYFYHSGKDKR